MKKYRNWIVSALGLLLWAVGFWMVKGDVRSTLAYVCIGLGCGMFGYGAGELIAGRVLKGAPSCSARWRSTGRMSATSPLPTAPRAGPST